ncbi:hypothetical protein JAO76_14200 [Pontibacter sp. BT310]|uniref:Uncharacterized protein n=1 Tax=Pontibacter populi TaxID=890055 RepID=A0ABS6XDZ6_9BACT|nr:MULTISPECIES: hypothetical protein [Pontibacter]MBJ6119357.1 hypothetical protein [Pontibacter sp. BT310]MBR0571785.1 hypothetical protein [Microvirga sp. STS03]MBW3366211.1 hypothetical protein [Pontibacter populi]
MFISLYSRKQLKRLKQNILMLGLFLVAGGIFTLVRELRMPEPHRIEFLFAAVSLIITGGIGTGVGLGFIQLKELYFSMNPTRLSFRHTFLGREHVLYWSQLSAIRVADSSIEFKLEDNRKVTLQLSTIPDERTARHIKASINLAALERNVLVNGVLARPKGAVA